LILLLEEMTDEALSSPDFGTELHFEKGEMNL
jgi:hypothetical protein